MTGSTTRIRQVCAAFAAAWNAHDMDALASLFAPDAEFVNVVGIWWKGRAAIQAAHEATHRTLFKNSRLTLTSTDVRFPVPDFAIARSAWTLEGHVDPTGAPLPPRRGLLVFVLRSHDDAWEIVDAQNTDVVEGVLSRPQ